MPPPPPPRRGVFSPEQFSSVARGEQLPLLNSSGGLSSEASTGMISATSERSTASSTSMSEGVGRAEPEPSPDDAPPASRPGWDFATRAVRGGGFFKSKLSSVLSDASSNLAAGMAGGPSSAVSPLVTTSISASAETLLVSHKRPQQRQKDAAQNGKGGSSGSMAPLEQQVTAEEEEPPLAARGGGTVFQTSLNIAKACMGTGTLALPYAACRGGLLFNLIGLGLLSLWNLYSVDRLLRCSELVPPLPQQSGGDGGCDDDDLDEEDGAGGEGGGGGKHRKRHSRCSRHKRTGSSMRKLFSRLMNDRVAIEDPGVEFGAGTAAADATSLLPPTLRGGADVAPAGGAGYGATGGATATAASPAERGWGGAGVAARRASAKEEPPPGTATYGRIAFCAFGRAGLHVLDVVMVVLLLGIIIAYEDAVASFLGPTPLSTGSAATDALLAVLVIAPLSCVPDMGYLGKFSACGIAAVLATFVVIFWYGLAENGLRGFGMVRWDDLWPQGGPLGVEGMSSWFGVTAFGYGIVPITYNIQESMRDPSQMSRATEMALLLVFLVYIVISNGVAIIYRPSTGPQGFEGDVLQELPVGWIPTAVRLAMTFVVLVTAPLLVVPCAQLVEGKLGIGTENAAGRIGLADVGSISEGWSARSFLRKHVKIVIRFVICLFCTGISIIVPGFVHVLSFVGAFCVSLTSFVFPPLLHLTLLRTKRIEESSTLTNPCFSGDAPVFKPDAATEEELMRFDNPREVLDKKGAEDLRTVSGKWTSQVDVLLLIWGIIATAVTSFLTFSDLFRTSETAHDDT